LWEERDKGLEGKSSWKKIKAKNATLRSSPRDPRESSKNILRKKQKIIKQDLVRG
jgi:hypothetical protein